MKLSEFLLEFNTMLMDVPHGCDPDIVISADPINVGSDKGLRLQCNALHEISYDEYAGIVVASVSGEYNQPVELSPIDDVVNTVKYWPEGVHTPDRWEYLGSVSTGANPAFLDVYRHKIKEQYEGISMQYGLKCNEYYSSSWVYIDDPVISLPDGIMKAFAIEYDRVKYRHTQQE